MQTQMKGKIPKPREKRNSEFKINSKISEIQDTKSETNRLSTSRRRKLWTMEYNPRRHILCAHKSSMIPMNMLSIVSIRRYSLLLFNAESKVTLVISIINSIVSYMHHKAEAMTAGTTASGWARTCMGWSFLSNISPFSLLSAVKRLTSENRLRFQCHLTRVWSSSKSRRAREIPICGMKKWNGGRTSIKNRKKVAGNSRGPIERVKEGRKKRRKDRPNDDDRRWKSKMETEVLGWGANVTKTQRT